jgi:mediator of RNA polymerase II transcription subunit 10
MFWTVFWLQRVGTQMEEKRKELEQHLESLIETLRHCIIIVEQFKPEESQSVFHDKLQNGVINKFKILDKFRDLYDVEIPLDVLDLIDQGRNPDLYSKEALEKCIKMNEVSKGKIDALEKFRTALETEVDSAFPEYSAEYKRLKQKAQSDAAEN